MKRLVSLLPADNVTRSWKTNANHKLNDDDDGDDDDDDDSNKALAPSSTSRNSHGTMITNDNCMDNNKENSSSTASSKKKMKGEDVEDKHREKLAIGLVDSHHLVDDQHDNSESESDDWTSGPFLGHHGVNSSTMVSPSNPNSNTISDQKVMNKIDALSIGLNRVKSDVCTIKDLLQLSIQDHKSQMNELKQLLERK
jgi:hypothetical protein